MAGPFVKVSGTQLVLNEKPFVFAGGNCYYLTQRLGSPGNSSEAIEVLDAAVKLGLTVMRTWAFNDGAMKADGGQNWNPIQPQPGVYDENMLVALDRLLVECGKRGLRVMPTLNNYWKDYGGMTQYARWSSKNASATAEDFFNDAGAQKMFRDFIKKIVLRTNSLTGKAYKDDPTILAWDICNEPECSNDPAAKKVAVWMDATAKYVKTLDTNHLVTCGSEGFFGGASTAAWLGYNPFNAVGKGCDFTTEFSSPALDFACIHMWHDQWMPGQPPAVRQAAAKMWILGHEKACRTVLKKPLVIQEYGAKAGPQERLPLFRLVHSMVHKSVATKGALVGSCAWMLGARTIGDYDGYTLYHPLAPGASGPAVPEDPDTIRELGIYAAKMRAPIKKPAPPPAPVAVAANKKPAPKQRDTEIATLEEFEDGDEGVAAAAAAAPTAAGVEVPDMEGADADWEGLEGFPEGLEEPLPDLDDSRHHARLQGQALPDPQEGDSSAAVRVLPPVDLKAVAAPATAAPASDVGSLQVDQALAPVPQAV